jgi:hypothetical protein
MSRVPLGGAGAVSGIEERGMAVKEEGDSPEAVWLPVIGRTLAYLSMNEAEQTRKFKGVLERVDFLEALGLAPADAAKLAGSSKASVDELRRRNRKADGKAAKKKRRAR